jgi:hypothetical protein
MNDKQDLLDVLKAELEFVERGGYRIPHELHGALNSYFRIRRLA